jgi:signal transduction histidine kinase
MIKHFVHLEDDPQLLMILKIALKSQYPDVIVAQFSDGTELLDYMQQPPSPVDMVMLDIRIIGTITGLQAAAEIRELGYMGPIIISSAYEAPGRQMLTRLDAEYIPKPWRIEKLLQHLMELSDSEPGTPTLPPVKRQAAETLIESGLFTTSVKKNLEHIARLLIQSLQVQGVVMLVADPKTWNTEYFNIYPSNHIADEAMFHLAANIMQKGKPLLLADASPHIPLSTGEAVSFAGLPFILKAAGLGGALCVYDLGERAWTETDHNLLHRSLELFVYIVKMNKSAAELAERNNDLNRYTDTVAHDLKTPLAAILNYAEMIKLLYGASLTPEVSTYIGSISDSANVMKDMITHLLWIARLENPEESVYAVNMEQVIQSALRRLDYAINSRGVSIVIETPSHFPPVLGHEVWLEEIVANLLSNAVKYIGENNPNPTIIIRSSRIGTHIRYEIEDNGIGISAEDQARLFHDFTRLYKVQAEGLGLGLAIVHRMVTRMSGDIGIVSEVGRGSLFWFALPVPPQS